MLFEMFLMGSVHQLFPLLQIRGLILLGALFIVVLFVYLIYRWVLRQKGVALQPQEDILPLQGDDEGYTTRAEEAVRAAGLSFSRMPIMGFFGSLSLVRHVGTDEYGLCLIPRSRLVDERSCERFHHYAQRVSATPIAGFAPVLWWCADEGLLVIVQGAIVNENGHLQMSLGEYLLDRRPSLEENERLLHHIASSLSHLHELKSDQGEQLYHGWLLPRSLFITVDSARKMSHVTLADGGFAFAFGSERFAAQIVALNSSYIGLDAFRSRRLIGELFNLAPEQKRGEEVGPAADLFAFGSLAYRLFAQRPLSGPVQFDWALVPAAWRSFLKSCLEPAPVHRPSGFKELGSLL